jgi:hypothetical protein
MSSRDRRVQKLVSAANALGGHRSGRRSSSIRIVQGAGSNRFDEAARRAAVAREFAMAKLLPPAPAAVNPPPPPAPAQPKAAKPGGRSRLRLLLRPTELPAVFTGAIRPLAIGTREQLLHLLPLATSYSNALWLEGKRKAIGQWLKAYTSRTEYLSALAAPGSQRYALDGTPAGEVAQASREHAATRLQKAER